MNKKLIASKINEYYGSLGAEYAGRIIQPENYESPVKVNIRDSIDIIPTDKHEVEMIIGTLKKNKAPGIDGINSNVL